jgi:Tat protein secretion system quality control protein TatD with DNase activity
MIRHTAAALAQAWFISIQEVAEITSQNARRLFFPKYKLLST